MRVILHLETVVLCMGDLVLGAGGASADGLPAVVGPRRFAILLGDMADTAGPSGVVDNPPPRLGRGDVGDGRGTSCGHRRHEIREVL